MNETTDVAASVYWMMLQQSMRAKHGLMKLAEAHELTVVQMYILCSVQPGEAVPMNALSGLLACDASNVTGVVDRLLTQGLLVREEKPEDRRVKMISLTAKGVALRRALFEDLPHYEPEELQRLSAEERGTLQQLLLKLSPQ